MRIKVLMTGSTPAALAIEAELLKSKGFLVYGCNEANVENMIGEIHPDVVYINPVQPGLESTRIYHEILNNVQYASIPVIYTLLEDDVYLVNRKRTASRDKRNIVCDNVLDAIKISLIATADISRKRKVPVDKSVPFPNYYTRA